MRTSAILVSLALGAGLMGGGLTSSIAGEHRAAPGNERQWLSIGQVHAKLEAVGYRNIEKIEREHGIYEARATDANGARVKLYINPQTGELTDRGDRAQDRRRRDREAVSNTAGESAPSSASSSRNSADCNKRRCRDDLPTSAAGAASSTVSSSVPSSIAPAAR